MIVAFILAIVLSQTDIALEGWQWVLICTLCLIGEIFDVAKHAG